MKRSVALAWATPSGWASRALEEPVALLSDHAHCELGAAAAAQGFVARAVEDAALVERMAALAVEELRHFRQVHRLLRDLGGSLEPVRRNPYVEGLAREARRDCPQGGLLLDRLLIAALVEARSLERFEALAACPASRATSQAHARLCALYAELAPSEAGHAQLFLELAHERFPSEDVDRRFAQLAEREGHWIRSLPFCARIHAGPPGGAQDSVRTTAAVASDVETSEPARV